MNNISPIKETDTSFEIQVKEARRRALEFQEYMKNSMISSNNIDNDDMNTSNINTSLDNSQLVDLMTEDEESYRERAARHSLLKDDTEVMEKNSILRVQNLQLQDEIERMRNIAQDHENAVHVRIREMENISTERDLWRARESALRRQMEMMQQELEVTRKGGSGNTSPSTSIKSLSPNSSPRHLYTHVDYNTQQQQYVNGNVNDDRVNGLLIGDGGDVPPAPPPTRVSSRVEMLTSHDSLSNSGHGVPPAPPPTRVSSRVEMLTSPQQQRSTMMNDSDTDPGLESLENEIDALIEGEIEEEESELSKSILDLPVPGMDMNIDMHNSKIKPSSNSSGEKIGNKSFRKIRNPGYGAVTSVTASIRTTNTATTSTTNPYEVVLSPTPSPIPVRAAASTTAASSPSRITAKDISAYTATAIASSSPPSSSVSQSQSPSRDILQSSLSFKSVSGVGVVDNPRLVPSSRSGLSAESFLKHHQDLMHKQAIRKAEFQARLHDDELKKVRDEAEAMKRQADKRQKSIRLKETKKQQAKEVKKLVESLSPKKAYVSPAKANPGIPSLREMSQSKEYNNLKNKGPGTSPAMRRYFSKVKAKVDTSLHSSKGKSKENGGSALNSSYNAFAKLTMAAAANNAAAEAMSSSDYPLPLPLPPSHEASHSYLHGNNQNQYDLYDDEEDKNEDFPYSSSAVEEINSSFYSNHDNSNDEDEDEDDEDLDGLNVVVNDSNNDRYIHIKNRIPSNSSGRKKTQKSKMKMKNGQSKSLRKLSSNSYVDGGVSGNTRIKGRKRVATIVKRIERAMGASTDLASSLDSDFRMMAPHEHHQMQMNNDNIYSFNEHGSHSNYMTALGSNSEHEGGMNRSQYLDSIPMEMDYEAHEHDITAGIAQAYYKHKRSLVRSNKKIKRKFDRLQKVVKNLASASGLRVKLVSNKTPTKTSSSNSSIGGIKKTTRIKNKNSKNKGGFIKPPPPPPTLPTRSGTRMQLRTTIAWMEKLKREHDDDYPMNYKMIDNNGSTSGRSIRQKKKTTTKSKSKKK